MHITVEEGKNSTGRGNTYLARILVTLPPPETFLGERYPATVKR